MWRNLIDFTIIFIFVQIMHSSTSDITADTVSPAFIPSPRRYTVASAQSSTFRNESSDTETFYRFFVPYSLAEKAKHLAFSLFGLLLIFRGLHQRCFEKLLPVLPIIVKSKQMGAAKLSGLLSYFRSKQGFFIAKQKIKYGASGTNSEEEKMETLRGAETKTRIRDIGEPLGRAVASVLAEVLVDKENYEKAHSVSGELSELMGITVKDALSEVLDCEIEKFVNDFERSFKRTYATLLLVKKERKNIWGKSASTQVNVTTTCPKLPIQSKVLETDRKLQPYPTKGCMQLDEADCMKENFCNFQNSNSPKIVGDQRGKSGVQLHSVLSEITSKIKSLEIDENCKGVNNSCTDSKVSDNDTLQPEELGVTDEQSRRYSVSAAVMQDMNCLENIEKSSIEHISMATVISEGFGENDAFDFGMGIGGESKQEMKQEDNSEKPEGQPDCKEESQKQLIRSSAGMPESMMMTAMSITGGFCENEFRESFLDLFGKSIKEKKRENDISQFKLRQKFMHLHLEAEHLEAQLESNKLMKENIKLTQSKACFKENAHVDNQLRRSYADLSRVCADELMAGLVVMFCCLAYGAWKFSLRLLSDAVAACHASYKAEKSGSKIFGGYFSNPVDSVGNGINLLMCQVKVISFVTIGIAVIFIVLCLLTRYTVTSSSQTRPATVILVILGGLCGWAGKFSVDSLGGSGYHWLLHWEALCLLHAFATCFTPWLFYFLNGSSSKARTFGNSVFPFWARKFIFHSMILLIFPAMAGLTPFASPKDWLNHFCKTFAASYLQNGEDSIYEQRSW